MSTCSHCWTRGHNKRGCPKLKKQAQDDRDAGRTTWRTGYVDEQARTFKTRRCSYCREVGHTRRTCQSLKANVKQFRDVNAVFRKKYLEGLKSIGFGVGTLVEQNYGFYRDGEHVEEPMIFMISSIDWASVKFTEGLNEYSECKWFTAVSLSSAPDGNRWSRVENGQHVDTLMTPPLESVYQAKRYWDNRQFEIVSPLSASCVQAGVPSGWFGGGDAPEMTQDKEFAQSTFRSWVSTIESARSIGFDYLPEF